MIEENKSLFETMTEQKELNLLQDSGVVLKRRFQVYDKSILIKTGVVQYER